MIKRANEQLWCWKGALSIPEFYSVADPGEGPGGPRPPLFLDQTKARRVEKNFLKTCPPPYLRVWMTAPPFLISRSGSGTVIYHPNSYNTSPMLSLFAVMAGQRQGGINWNTFYFLKYINSHDSFYWRMFHEPLTQHIQWKAHFCDLRPYKRTFYESFYTLPIITTKHKADNRVDSTVSVNQKVGYIKIYRETTREMGRTVLIRYD